MEDREKIKLLINIPNNVIIHNLMPAVNEKFSKLILETFGSGLSIRELDRELAVFVNKYKEIFQLYGITANYDTTSHISYNGEPVNWIIDGKLS